MDHPTLTSLHHRSLMVDNLSLVNDIVEMIIVCHHFMRKGLSGAQALRSLRPTATPSDGKGVGFGYRVASHTRCDKDALIADHGTHTLTDIAALVEIQIHAAVRAESQGVGFS